MMRMAGWREQFDVLRAALARGARVGVLPLLQRDGVAEPDWCKRWRALGQTRASALEVTPGEIERLLQDCLEGLRRDAGFDESAIAQVRDVTQALSAGVGLLPVTPSFGTEHAAAPKGVYPELVRTWLQSTLLPVADSALAGWRAWAGPETKQVAIPVLLVAGSTPARAVHARLIVTLVRAPGAMLAWVPAPGSALLGCDPAWDAALERSRQWLRAQVGTALDDHALAWDLYAPAATLHLIAGDSAGAAFALAAFRLARSDLLDPRLRAQAYRIEPSQLARLSLTASLDEFGRLGGVGSGDVKSQLVPLWQAASPQQGLVLHLAQDDPLPQDFDRWSGVRVERHRRIGGLVSWLAQEAEQFTPEQERLNVALLAADGTEAAAPARDLNLMAEVARQASNSLRQYLLRCWAWWEQQFEGRVQQLFVPLELRPDATHWRIAVPELGPISGVQEMIRRGDRLGSAAYVLRGLPGAGKTTMLRHHLQWQARETLRQWDETPADDRASRERLLEVPVYVQLNQFEPPPDWSRETLDAWLPNWIRRHLAGAPEGLLQLMQGRGPWHDDGLRARVLLDGMNELPVSVPGEALSPLSRTRRVAALVFAFWRGLRGPAARESRPLPMLLTVRHHELGNLPEDELGQLLQVDVVDWQEPHIRQYLGQRFPQASRSPRMQARIDGLLSDQALFELCQRPLHLAQHADLLEALRDEASDGLPAGDASPPSDRASLYRAWIWMRVRRELGYGRHARKPDPAAWTGLLDDDAERDAQTDEGPRGQLPGLPGGVLFDALQRQAHVQWLADDGQPMPSRAASPVALDTVATHLSHDPALRERVLKAAASLGLAVVSRVAGRWAWSWAHQSYGEYLASCWLLAGVPKLLGPSLAAIVSAPPLRPGSADRDDADEAEFVAIEQLGAPNWERVDPSVWERLLGEGLRIPEREFVDLRFGDTAADAAHHAKRLAQLLRELRNSVYPGNVLSEITHADGEFAVSLAVSGYMRVDPSAAGLDAKRAWWTDPRGWQFLVHERLLDSVRPAFWRRLGELLREQLGDARAAEELLARLQAEPGRLELPPAPEGRQVVGLALLGLERDDDLRGWLQWLVLNGHWPVLAEVLPPLVRRLEGAQPGVPAGHGRVREPVLQHLRRVLLLTSVDAGAASLPQLQASGLLGLLDAEPAVAMPEPLQAQWRALRAGAFHGAGVRLRHRLQAGLMLGWLGDNIRYEYVERAPPSGGTVRGLRPKPALWAEVGVPGRKTAFPIGSSEVDGWLNEWPEWPAKLEHFRICRLPLTVGEWRCFMKAGADPAHESHAARLAGWNNPLQPVTGISWDDAVAYATWAQALYEPQPVVNGRVLRLGLPSEVQWEAAVRGPRGMDPFAPSFEPSRVQANQVRTRWMKPSPVSVFSACPSPLGLFDALGNVWEWCSNGDTAEGFDEGWTTSKRTLAQAVAGDDAPLRALRGGAYCSNVDHCRPACRLHDVPDGSVYHCVVGARLGWSWAPRF
jgi:formylglycine-generating enzyme required for sulfatase activity